MNPLRGLTWPVLLLLVINSASAQEPARTPMNVTPLSFRSLSETTPQPVSPTSRVRELRIRWTATSSQPSSGTQPAAVRAMEVVSDRRFAGVVRRERRPELSADQLVIVQRDSTGRALDWIAIPDPRLIRAEVPDADGRLTGRIVQRDDAELLVTVTQLPATVSLAIYQPRWTGSEYLLDLVGEVGLPRTQ